MLGLVVGPGVVLGVGLVVLGLSVPIPPAAPELVPEDDEPLIPEELRSDELLPDSEGIDEVPELDEPEPDVPPDELLSEGMPELPLLLPEPDLPPEPLPIMPEHATISIAQATDIIHLIIDHSR